MEGIKLSFDEKQLIAGLIKVADHLEGLKNDLKEVEAAREKAFEAGNDVSKFDKQIIKLQSDIAKTGTEFGKAANIVADDFGKSLKQAQKDGGGFREGVKGISKQINVLGVNLGDTIDKLKDQRKALQANLSALGGTTKGFKALKLAIAATGIGALVVVLGSLYSAFTRTDEGARFVEKTFNQVGAIIDVVLDRAAALGTAIIQLFKGDFSGAAESARAAISGVGEELVNEFNQAGEITTLLQNVREEEAKLDIQRSATNKRLKELNFLIEDQTKGYKERINAAVEFANIEEGLTNKQIRNQENKIAALLGEKEITAEVREELEGIAKGDISLDQLGISNSTIKDLEQFRDEAKRLFELEERSLEIQTTNNNKVNQIRKEQRDQATAAATERAKALEVEQKRIESLSESYRVLVSTITERLQSEDFEKLSGADKLIEQRRIAIIELEKLEKELTLAAQAVGTEVDPATRQKIAALYKNIEAEFKTEIDKLREGNEVLNLPVPDFLQGTDFEKIGSEVSEGITRGFQQSSPLSVFEQFRNELKELLGATDQELNFLFDNLGNLGNSFLDTYFSNIDAAISEQEKIVESYDKSISELEKKLEIEKKAAEEGKANSVELLQSQLAEENTAREEAENKRLELEQKAAQQRLIIEALQQASALALAGAKLFAAEAGKGLVGIALAVGGLATIISTIAAFKAQAAKASQPPELREGGSISDELGLLIGPSHMGGGIPGHYTDSKGNRRAVELEGNEFVTRASSVNNETRPILEQINKTGKVPFERVKKTPGSYAISPMSRMKKFNQDTEKRKQQESGNNEVVNELKTLRTEIKGLKAAFKEKDEKQFHPDGSYHHRRKDARGNEQIDFIKTRNKK